MRLLDLHPEWVSTGGEGITNAATGEPVPLREKIGICCDCPKCGPEVHPLFVPFKNPLDGGPPTHPVTWERTPPLNSAGQVITDQPITDSFENLTLCPSILRKDCGWHGFIKNGEIETV